VSHPQAEQETMDPQSFYSRFRSVSLEAKTQFIVDVFKQYPSLRPLARRLTDKERHSPIRAGEGRLVAELHAEFLRYRQEIREQILPVGAYGLPPGEGLPARRDGRGKRTPSAGGCQYNPWPHPQLEEDAVLEGGGCNTERESGRGGEVGHHKGPPFGKRWNAEGQWPQTQGTKNLGG
jgi:hypothetical protein